MCGSSASVNLAVLLAACGLLTADGAGDAADGSSSLSNDPRCSPLLSVVLGSENGIDGATSRTLGNGSFLHDGIVYPAELRWTDGNITYGCICRLLNCIKKCCRDDEVLHEDSEEEESDMPTCQKMPWNNTKLIRAGAKTPDLRLSRDQMTEEIQHIDNLREHFHLVQEDNFCSGRLVFSLNPNQYGDDTIILQTNGSFMDADGKIVPFWNYCIDWKVTVDQIGILVCPAQVAPNEKEPLTTHHHVGIMVSIPFLIVTFLVYAITPELRNLYGKTLMCYVICLIIAYVFLMLVNYIYMSPIPVLCISTGKQHPYVSANCNNRHFPNFKPQIFVCD